MSREDQTLVTSPLFKTARNRLTEATLTIARLTKENEWLKEQLKRKENP